MSQTVRADVCVIGAGIVGLHNALQYARRGFSVVIIDELTERGKSAYKVGESLLIYSNAFLRTIGGLDRELSESFEKRGVWFTYGLEGKEEFDADVSEWGFQHAIPERWKDAIEDKKFQRTMFGDCQIVRPEIEAVLRDRLKQFEKITLIDRGLVRDVELGTTPGKDSDHVLTWRSKDDSTGGTVRTRWLIDCSGRARLLVKRFGHDVPLADDFSTSSVWGQFSGCTDAFFDERWNFEFPDGYVVRRDLDTVHLWGDGYWVWLIRLAKDRISVGVSMHRTRIDLDRNLRNAFWQIIRRYPMLNWLQQENVLDFQAYRDVQYVSDTYVSPDRYIIVGDASSIIDAYYSQGISLSLSTSWHGANIAERDLREGVLDTAYIRHVNKAVLADWRIMRSMVKSKYGPAVADSRFFILDHWIDYLVIGAATGSRWGISRWLSQTDGYPGNETPDLAGLRVRHLAAGARRQPTRDHRRHAGGRAAAGAVAAAVPSVQTARRPDDGGYPGALVHTTQGQLQATCGDEGDRRVPPRGNRVGSGLRHRRYRGAPRIPWSTRPDLPCGAARRARKATQRRGRRPASNPDRIAAIPNLLTVIFPAGTGLSSPTWAPGMKRWPAAHLSASLRQVQTPPTSKRSTGMSLTGWRTNAAVWMDACKSAASVGWAALRILAMSDEEVRVLAHAAAGQPGDNRVVTRAMP
jgi:2-polyprenyl-6-methoxyphenol hydroxylase-like FAD-dependent oxidoreductase